MADGEFRARGISAGKGRSAVGSKNERLLTFPRQKGQSEANNFLSLSLSLSLSRSLARSVSRARRMNKNYKERDAKLLRKRNPSA
jgi:hypothetical protein